MSISLTLSILSAPFLANRFERPGSHPMPSMPVSPSFFQALSFFRYRNDGGVWLDHLCPAGVLSSAMSQAVSR